jgi:hypothetical protein
MSHCHLAHHESHMAKPVIEAGLRWREDDNYLRLKQGTVQCFSETSSGLNEQCDECLMWL